MNITNLYRARFKKSAQKRKNEIWSVLCRNFFQKFIKKEMSCLEIACGYGEFINNVSASKKYAIDLNQDSSKYLNKDIKFIQKNVLDLTLNDLDEKVDVVFISNFLEHLSNKKSLEKLLVIIKKILKDDGLLLIMGPNLKYLGGTYWDFYDHELGLTHLSLAEVLNNFDYEILLNINKFLPFTVESRLPTHPFLVYIYLKIPFVWKLLGKQFFIFSKNKK